MKKEIWGLIIVILCIIGFPFFIKWDSQMQEKQKIELQKKQYQEAIVCIEEKEYKKAREILEKLPYYYQNVREILSYAKYGEAAANGEDTEQLYKLTWNFPDSKEYNGEFAAEMKQAETDMEVKYEKYEKEQEKKEREEAKKGRPYKGMSEKYINITLLGHYDKKEKNIIGEMPLGNEFRSYNIDISGMITMGHRHGMPFAAMVRLAL